MVNKTSMPALHCPGNWVSARHMACAETLCRLMSVMKETESTLQRLGGAIDPPAWPELDGKLDASAATWNCGTQIFKWRKGGDSASSASPSLPSQGAGSQQRWVLHIRPRPRYMCLGGGLWNATALWWTDSPRLCTSLPLRSAHGHTSQSACWPQGCEQPWALAPQTSPCITGSAVCRGSKDQNGKLRHGNDDTGPTSMYSRKGI